MTQHLARNFASPCRNYRLLCTFLPAPSILQPFQVLSRATGFCIHPRKSREVFVQGSFLRLHVTYRGRFREYSRSFATAMTQTNQGKDEQGEPKLPTTENEAMRRKADMIMAKLKEVYPKAPEGFLDHKDPFTLLVAVVLSAQCLDSTVNAVTPGLFAVADTPEKMRDLGVAKIQKLIKRIGLSASKAKYLAGLSEAICRDHNGEVPQTLEELEKLPGVGHKTASVLLIHAFGTPAFPVDTHIHRLACRWGAGDARSVEKTEATLKEWFPDPSTWAELHVRIILFGREHCPARKHDMEACPICSFAATSESRATNRSSPGKFVAPKVHKDPYSIRAVGDGTSSKGLTPGPSVPASQNSLVASAGKKNRRHSPVGTKSEEHFGLLKNDSKQNAGRGGSRRKRRKKTNNGQAAEGKTTSTETSDNFSNSTAPAKSAGDKVLKNKNPKVAKAKPEMPNPIEQEGMRRSARIAAQK